MTKTSTSTVDTRNFTRRSAPGFPYQKMAQAIAPGWEISLVFVGKTRAQSLNKALRKKSYVPNVLSYVTGKKSGEIIICLEVAKQQGPSYDLSYKNFLAFLFIHGLLHLLGRPHGPTMERHERTFLKRWTGAVISYDDTPLSHGRTTHRNGN